MKKKRLGIKKKGVEIDDDDDFVHVSTSKIADHICNLMGCFKGKGYKCGNCDFYKRHRYELLKLYYAFDINNVDKCIALYDYLKKSVYFYYEFYANTFIAMIPFTFVAPLYMVKRLNLDFSNAAYIGIALIVLTIVCLDFAWMAYERWISVLYFAFCRCFEGKTLGEKEEHSVEINWD